MSVKKKVLMYSSNYCPFCFRAKALLEKKGLELEELIVDQNPELRQKMMQDAGRHTVPQIWIGEQHVGGCDDLFLLERQGLLDKLLTGN
jgi:glutaredoxin 3